MQTNDTVKLPAFFDEYPEIKLKMVESLQGVSEEQKRKTYEDFQKFVNGDMTWAELRGISKRLQKELARFAYLQLKLKNYKKAELMFKGLAMVDHTNWYFRGALGSVYQSQTLYHFAIQEYGIALELKPDEPSVLLNRAESYLFLKRFDEAKADLQAILAQDKDSQGIWGPKAELVIRRMKQLGMEATL